MMQIHKYLETRFREYFRDALDINVGQDDELTLVDVTLPNSLEILHFVCEPGSDDDCFVFIDYRGQDHDDAIEPSQVITIPFPKEA